MPYVTAVSSPMAASMLKKGWRRLEVTVDSGAAESVIPADEIPEYPLKKHEHDIYYSTATGEPIMNMGEQRIPMFAPSGKPCSMTL